MKEFQKRLIELRKESKLSQRKMAEKLNISQPSYIRYEHGTAEPNLDKLVKMAKIFDIPTDYLLGIIDL